MNPNKRFHLEYPWPTGDQRADAAAIQVTEQVFRLRSASREKNRVHLSFSELVAVIAKALTQASDGATARVTVHAVARQLAELCDAHGLDREAVARKIWP